MSIEIIGLATLRISSSNVAQSRAWYEELFGIEPVEVLEDFVAFRVNDTNFEIAQADAKSPSSAGGSIGYWLVSDLGAVIAEVQALGGKIYRGPLEVAETERTIVQILDPIGNVVGFEAPTEE